MPLDYSTPQAQVRLLINDTTDSPVFADSEIDAFLALELDSIKRAAAQALDTIADDEVLTAKVISDHQLTTNGASVADSLRKRAATLRAQAADDKAVSDGVPAPRGCFPPPSGLPRW